MVRNISFVWPVVWGPRPPGGVIYFVKYRVIFVLASTQFRALFFWVRMSMTSVYPFSPSGPRSGSVRSSVNVIVRFDRFVECVIVETEVS